MIGLSFKKPACNRRPRRPSPGSRAGAWKPSGSRTAASAVRHDVQARSPDMPAGRLGRLPGRGGIEFQRKYVGVATRRAFGGDVELPPAFGIHDAGDHRLYPQHVRVGPEPQPRLHKFVADEAPGSWNSYSGARGCCRASAPPMPGWSACAVPPRAGCRSRPPAGRRPRRSRTARATARPGSSSTRPRNPAIRRRWARAMPSVSIRARMWARSAIGTSFSLGMSGRIGPGLHRAPAGCPYRQVRSAFSCSPRALRR